MVMDDWNRRNPQLDQEFYNLIHSVSRKEFEELKAEVTALKDLLIAAKIYDEKTGQPNCEKEEKIALLKNLADQLGIDMSEVFGQGGISTFEETV